MSNDFEVRYEKKTCVGEHSITETIEGTSEAVLKVLCKTEPDNVIQNLNFHIAPGFKVDEVIEGIRVQVERMRLDGNGH